jgi:hypothetical protein
MVAITYPNVSTSYDEVATILTFSFSDSPVDEMDIQRNKHEPSTVARNAPVGSEPSSIPSKQTAPCRLSS